MKTDFLTAPAQWTRAPRHGGTRVDYACGVQVFRTRRSRWDRAARWTALAVVLAAVALAYA